MLEAWFWGKLAGGYSTRKYKSQTKNRILASESNLRLGSILLVKIWLYLKRAKQSIKVTSKELIGILEKDVNVDETRHKISEK